jgi:hypothetical protein
MKKYEYKTIELKLRGIGIFGPKKADDFEDTLTREGASGWRYVDTLPETGAYGEASRIKLVFERVSE